MYSFKSYVHCFFSELKSSTTKVEESLEDIQKKKNEVLAELNDISAKMECDGQKFLTRLTDLENQEASLKQELEQKKRYI